MDKAKKPAKITAKQVADAARDIQKQQAKNNPIEKARQELTKRQLTVNYGRIYEQN